MNYPPHIIQTPDGNVNILQLTDPHLTLDVSEKTAGINCYDSLKACIAQALSEELRCDLILVTGDLVNEVKTKIYDRIFKLLCQTGIPFACIAGNHDVTDEEGIHLPFDKRTLIAHQPDPRLLSCHCIEANTWRILLLDSSIPGSVGGRISKETLSWLQSTLQETEAPVVIAMHHHIVPMTSTWINTHIAVGAEDFWTLIEKYPSVKAVINGHVHQKYEIKRGLITSYSTPSTCYQFKPNQDNFSLDTDLNSGYRWLQLNKNKTIRSWVNRLKS